MCRYCQIVWALLGPGYLCRPCWRKHYRNKKKGQ
jgi:hypothetical protein